MSTELNNVSSDKNRDFGIQFAITNSKGVKSYLIGTIHIVDKESVQDPAIQEIIGKCSALYSESGMNCTLFEPQASMPEGDHQYSNFPFRYSYDTAITLAAWLKKIPIFSLDEGVPHRDQAVAEGRKALLEIGINELELTYMQVCSLNSAGPEYRSSLREWKNSNTASFKKSRMEDSEHYPFDRYITQREEHWVKTLIPKLLNTEQPIAIAVGVNHVVGEDSLSERFARAGLKVEIISSGLTHKQDMVTPYSRL